jgi:ATP-dependent DNA helicase RecQ
LQDWQQIQRALKQHWGYERLRPPQDQVIRALLDKRDALVVLPTGFGKSLCFQLVALLQTGVTLVVSPLIALMEDQVQDLWKRKLPAACLHSELDPALRKRVLKALEENRLRLLYLGPETLFSPPVWQRLQQPQVHINGLIVDEAHTLVHWGGSFRPDYRRLGLLRPALAPVKPSFPIAAFTATADPQTCSRLSQILGLRDPEHIRADPLRANLSLNVAIAWSPADRRRRLLRFLGENPGSGLVYVRTRRDGEELAEWLGRQNLKTATYHGGLEAGSRRRLERAWLQGELRFLVCTNALGMGINKPDVRWVLHFHPPPSLMDYLQEVGRGGRDGGPCRALMLVCLLYTSGSHRSPAPSLFLFPAGAPSGPSTPPAANLASAGILRRPAAWRGTGGPGSIAGDGLPALAGSLSLSGVAPPLAAFKTRGSLARDGSPHPRPRLSVAGDLALFWLPWGAARPALWHL